MDRINRLRAVICCLVALTGCSPQGQKNVVIKDGFVKTQHIPGRLQCELYNAGGEGVAYHDTDTINNGSGKLNPANGSVLNEFRMHEAVDISYTKPNGIDDNPFNKVKPIMDQLYVGWTQPGEWLNYTIRVDKTGRYRLALMYTSNRGGVVSFDIDHKPATGPLSIHSTYHAQDTIAWRHWHHWNRTDSLTAILLQQGSHVFTLHVVEQGNMNFDYIDFIPE